MKASRSLSAAMIVSALLAILGGCQKPAGPAESAGKEVDKVVEKAGQQLERAGEKIQDTASGDKK